MAKLIMLSGLPGSGKSTRANEILKEGNSVRLNKDLLREMLHGGKFSGKNEELTKDAEMALARYFLGKNISVVVDDTNLGEGHRQRWLGLSKELNCKWNPIKIETSMEECLLRDKARLNPVGADVICRMALQYGLAPKPVKGYILCDLDGTVADITHRLHYVKMGKCDCGGKDDCTHIVDWKPDWKSFFASIHADIPRHEIIQKIRGHFIDGYDIVFVSARPENYKKDTISWLSSHVGIEDYYLLMRRADDHRDDVEVKRGILETYFPNKKLIYKVFDDRPKVIRMWQEEGLDVEDVGSGIEF